MTSMWYPTGIKRLIDVGADGINARMALLHNSVAYSWNEAHDFMNDVVASEVVDASYARKAAPGDFTWGSQVDLANDRVEIVFTGPNLIWANLAAGFNLSHLILYDHVGAADSGNYLLAAWEISPVIPTNGQNFTVTFNSTDGNLRISYA